MPDLQTAWFLVLAFLVAGYAVLDGFDLGVGCVHLFLARTDRERRLLLNAIGPVWDGNEVWLVALGGALFAAFPNVYATVFSGLYVPTMLLLLFLVLRAVSLEFRSKEDGAAWRRLWDGSFALGSFGTSALLGLALGNVVRGLPIGEDGELSASVVSLLSPFAIVCALASVAMMTMQGAAWLHLKTEGELKERARKVALLAFVAFLAAWVLAVTLSLGASHLWTIYTRPAGWLLPFLAHGALVGFALALRRGAAPVVPPFAFSSAAILFLVGIVAQSLYPNLAPALVPSRSLTIANASSSEPTLRTMLWIALVTMPVVLAYTVFVYSRFRGPVRLDENSY